MGVDADGALPPGGDSLGGGNDRVRVHIAEGIGEIHHVYRVPFADCPPRSGQFLGARPARLHEIDGHLVAQRFKPFGDGLAFRQDTHIGGDADHIHRRDGAGVEQKIHSGLRPVLVGQQFLGVDHNAQGHGLGQGQAF